MQMSMISIASLIITEFRKFRNRRIDFTKPITLITGHASATVFIRVRKGARKAG